MSEIDDVLLFEAARNPDWKAPREALVQLFQLRSDLEEQKRHAYVWADDATPFTGPEVIELLNKNEKLRLDLAEARKALETARDALEAITNIDDYDPKAFTRAFRIASNYLMDNSAPSAEAENELDA